MSRDNNLSSIALFSSIWVDVVTNFLPCLSIYSSLAIHLFLAIRKQTLELVSLAYTLVASTEATGCLHTLDMINHSSTYVGDVWSSGVDTLWHNTTLCWYLLKEMFRISPFYWSLRISVPLLSLETLSSSGCGEVGKSTSWWWCIWSMSYSDSHCSISMSNFWSACSISWVKSFSYDGSPCLPDAICSDESTTYMSIVSSICTCYTPFCTCFYYTSLSYLHSSYSFQSFSFNIWNSFSTFSILPLSLFL